MKPSAAFVFMLGGVIGCTLGAFGHGAAAAIVLGVWILLLALSLFAIWAESGPHGGGF